MSVADRPGTAGGRRGVPPLPPRAALRWHVVRRIVAHLRPESVLELGCGLGAVGMRLARTTRYAAVEPDGRSFEVAYRRITPLGGTVHNGDHRQVPEGGPYDLVCAFEVLEHLADDATALAEWLPLVRPGGHLLLSVPADPDRFGPWDTLVGHYRRYSAAQLRQRLTTAGAVPVQMIHYGWPLGYLLDSVRDRLAARRDTAVAPAAGAVVPAAEAVIPTAGGSGTAERAGTVDRAATAATPEERTSSSGRILQPAGVLAGGAIRLAVAPFALLQRMRPDRGPGLVALARRPTDDPSDRPATSPAPPG
ncbi:class I SAM-dependent methyltransferase [Plantactinospora sp. CA-290183]|uniref:class I SAM-dependent methyltransferase n=1 Tax=Plantactinospora sp. CA-290183 TaxID=3240006 RepID=UPI003D8AE489